jgi:cytochrome oxidase Cu insertion factor (SCO1/SenC/PrrC family)
MAGSRWIRARLALAGFACCLAVSCGHSPTDSGSSGGGPQGSQPSFEELFGSSLVMADGRQVDLRSVQGQALIGIYFAEHSCAACAAFTPRLVSAYNEIKAADKSFEIVLVNLDENSEVLFAFMQMYSMAWPAVPYDRARIAALLDRYRVASVPTVVILDEERNTITKTGRKDVESMGAQAYDAWLAARARQ